MLLRIGENGRMRVEKASDIVRRAKSDQANRMTNQVHSQPSQTRAPPELHVRAVHLARSAEANPAPPELHVRAVHRPLAAESNPPP
eukprot:587449-Prymnesium_polylepis.1